MQTLIVAGIGTEVGKTVVSSILVHLLKADYWKPVSCGPFSNRDTVEVTHLCTHVASTQYPEAYNLQAATSPHLAATLEKIELSADEVQIPQTENSLVIEMAGGLLVPLNQQELLVDCLKDLDAGWILVSKNYLGSINHTLLSIEAMRARNLHLLGLVFNGPETPSTEKYISDYTGVPIVGRLDQEEKITQKTIERYQKLWREQPFWKKLLL